MLRLIFAGTPAFAATVLDAVVQAGHEVALVLCQPDRPAGRGQRLVAPPVKQRALELGLAVGQPARLREEVDRAPLRAAAADLMLVVAYGLIQDFTPVVGRVATGGLIVGSILLAPAIVLGYAIKAAEKDDRARGI